MDKYDFLLASENDIPEIIGIYHSLIGTPGCTWNEYYPTEEIARSDIESGSLYILKEGAAIVAVAAAGPFDELGSLRWSPQNPCELARIGVVPALHRQGIGTMLLRKVMEAVKKRGFDGIIMLVSKSSPAALALYDRNGFERCGDAFMFGFDFYCYQMQFAPAAKGQSR
ncbi:MAG: GNAT family N-acetyltransferase [Oscillospiraceae bacterium]|jgi:ribosomal protein S18 acetylase RimI-like enzyme|nr:GNAT family N-acetyltransferase [Oscillospiraceae bacterium]